MATIEGVIFFVFLLAHDTNTVVREERGHIRGRGWKYSGKCGASSCIHPEALPCANGGLIGRNHGCGACYLNEVTPIGSEEAKIKRVQRRREHTYRGSMK